MWGWENRIRKFIKFNMKSKLTLFAQFTVLNVNDSSVRVYKNENMSLNCQLYRYKFIFLLFKIFTIMSFQTCMTFFLLLNKKEAVFVRRLGTKQHWTPLASIV